MVYQFKEGGKFLRKNVNPQQVGEALHSIQRDAGKLESREVLERARDAESPLHPCFTWDDGIAAEAYRLDQARSLVKSIVKVKHEGEAPVQAYYNVVVKRAGDEGETRERYYQSSDVIVKNRDEFDSARDILMKEFVRAKRSLDELELIAPRRERPKIRRAKEHTDAAHAALA